ncbi:MAG TPA: hypothetical protein VGR53_07005 [Nitrososphaerales archaeon]|nr:hypothetical protein [Nitrososphaerales archaeon]
MVPTKAGWPYPGKVLIVDDIYDEYIAEAVSQLLGKGVPVEYWNPRKEKRREFANVRVVLLDIILDEADLYLTGANRFANAISALLTVKGSPVVIILSNTTDEPSSLVEAIKAKGIRYAGVIASERMSKEDLDDSKKLMTLVAKCLRDSPLMDLILSWEGLIDLGKDKALQSISGEGAEVVSAFLKILENQFGSEGLKREFVDTAIRILSRYSHEGPLFDALGKSLTRVVNTRGDVSDEAGEGVLSMLMYYNPGSEKMWTGDIYLNPRGSSLRYAIVLTPACDFAQRQPTSVVVAFGFEVTEEVINKHSSILYRRDPTLSELVLLLESKERTVRQEAKGRLENKKKRLLDGSGFQEHLFPLRHIQSNGKFIDVCFDLEDIVSKPLKEIKEEKWARITRLDTPYVEGLLQHFGKHVSRIGVPEANWPMERIGVMAARKR